MSSNEPPGGEAQQVRDSLLELSHHAATFEDMAILGEGNVSGRVNDECFLIKASGTQLSTLTSNQLVEVKSQVILDSLGTQGFDDDQVEALLLESRRDPESLKPSVETLFHACLLQHPGIEYVGHTHPIHVNQLLCSPQAKEFAERRLFPDQIVYCGTESILIPYVDPGMTLARRIAEEVESFIDRTGTVPKTILLENHGLIAVGATANQVAAALMMTEKSAMVFAGAKSCGGPIFMPEVEVQRIASRSDEHYRQRMLEQQANQ